MTGVELLSYLRTRDVKLWVDGDRLRYNAPSGVVTPAIRAELSKYKAEIFAFLHDAGIATRLEHRPIQPIPRETNILPSINQERLWFIDRLSPNTAAYNFPVTVRLNGVLHFATLEQSLSEIVRRHEALRTTFPSIDGQPFQMINPPLPLRLPIIDLSEFSEATEREAEMERLVTEEVERPFDLAEGPLFRPKLLRLSEAEHVLLLTMHHIVTDQWSIAVLWRELAVLYEAFSAGKSSPLPELRIQYADFASCQRERMQGEIIERHLSYWKQRLKDAPALLELPTDLPRPPVQTFRGSSHSLVLSKALTEALNALSRQEGVTLFMILLAAFQTLLYRYTGQEDIVVGSPIAGRVQPELENLIGFFVNTLVLRTDLSNRPSFRELLHRVREVTLGAYAHQEVPFERLTQELAIKRSLSYTPLFQVMFVFQNTPEFRPKLPGLNISRLKARTGTAKFDLMLAMFEGLEGLHGSWSYSSDLFDSSTIARMTKHFQALLETAVANPDRPLATLPFLTKEERHQLLVEWNDTKKDWLKNKCIHELFEERTEEVPENIAVVFENSQLTYRELNKRANQLAHYLKRRGVRPEVLVGICVNRSLETIIGLLGVLKAGAVYLPLDPNYPKERLASILEDARVSVLLTQQQLLEHLPKQGVKVVCLDSGWEAISQESEENPAEGATADNLAYVIYTSGSTGRPKGVEITHKALMNFATSACATFELRPSDRVLQFASISFDTAAEEIFPCLVRGATLVLRTDYMLDSVAVFLRNCGDWGITILDLPTVYWHELTEHLCSQRLILPERLRLVIIGGERALPQQLRRWRQHVGAHVRLLNTYGPTETTVVATMWELTAQADESLREIPIGHPIPNAQTYVLDQFLNPVPIGVPGELHIGGVGLARAYLNSPELTAEKLIPNPFSGEAGARFYKTGDLARFRPDGNIEFLGRLDHQVKIRGFRIELEEIEAVLSQHPAVREAVVLAREEIESSKSQVQSLNSDKYLVAYVVSSRDGAVISDELRGFLKEKVPDYMVPARFVFLGAMPLTSNGKLDRKALPEPESGKSENTASLVAPRTVVEHLIADIWADVLKLDNLGVHDNFFDLGGHSLKATQIMSRVRETFRMDLPLRILFEAPTVAELASRVEQNLSDAAELDKIARYLAEVASLSDDELERQLAKKTEN